MTRRLLMLVLSSLGMSVKFADDGQRAVELARASEFDLVLMDMQMPQLSGLEATAELRLQGFEKPIIALTAHAMVQEKQRALDVGCNDHITKPIDRAKLVEKIKRLTRPPAAASSPSSTWTAAHPRTVSGRSHAVLGSGPA